MYDEFDSVGGGGGGGGDCCGCSKSGNNWSQPPGNPAAGNLSGKLLLDDLLMINHDRDLTYMTSLPRGGVGGQLQGDSSEW